MRYMNEWDIDEARARFTRASKPNRLGLVMVIDALKDWTNDNSDGWAYWPKPVAAARKAIELVDGGTYAEREAQEEVDATDAEVKAAVAPIKAFLTRQAKETNRFGNPRVSAEERERILRGVEVLR